jgi:hypothetical protein
MPSSKSRKVGRAAKASGSSSKKDASKHPNAEDSNQDRVDGLDQGGNGQDAELPILGELGLDPGAQGVGVGGNAVNAQDDVQVAPPETDEEARQRVEAGLQAVGTRVAAFRDPASIQPLQRTLAQAETSLRAQQAFIANYDTYRTQATQDLARLNTELSAPNLDDAKRGRVTTERDRKQQTLDGMEGRRDRGTDDEAQVRDDARDALNQELDGQRQRFDQAITDLGALGSEAERRGWADLVARAEALKREVIRRKALDENLRPGHLRDFARTLGVDLDVDATALDPDELDFTHMTFTINTAVPGREDFASMEENRQTQHALGSEDAWTGEIPGNVDAQIAALTALVDDAWLKHQLQLAELKARDPNVQDHDVLSVFVGPEWFFGFSRVYNAEQKAQVVDALTTLSAAYPGMLLVPGTILWSPDNRGVLNTQPILMNGAVLREPSKKKWGGDTSDKDNFIGVDHPDRQRYVRREEESPFLEVGGVKFALDICQDHFSAQAKQQMYGQQNPGSGVDVHLVVSSGQTVNDYAVTSDVGGYALQSDADRAEGDFKAQQVTGGTHGKRTLANVGVQDNKKGQRSSNEAQSLHQGGPSLGVVGSGAAAYDERRKNDYKRLGTAQDAQKKVILEGMLAYAQDHTQDNDRQAKKARVRGMIAAAEPIAKDPRQELMPLASRVIASLRALRLH